jgi:hypothetical protein
VGQALKPAVRPGDIPQKLLYHITLPSAVNSILTKGITPSIHPRSSTYVQLLGSTLAIALSADLVHAISSYPGGYEHEGNSVVGEIVAQDVPTPFMVALEYSNTGNRLAIQKSKAYTHQYTYLVPDNSGLTLRSVILVATDRIHTSQSKLLDRARETYARLAAARAAPLHTGLPRHFQAATGYTPTEASTLLGAMPKPPPRPRAILGPPAETPSDSGSSGGSLPTLAPTLAPTSKARPTDQSIFEQVLAEPNAELAAHDAMFGDINTEVAHAIRLQNPDLLSPDTELLQPPPGPGPASDQGQPALTLNQRTAAAGTRQRQATRRFDTIAANALRMLDDVADN